MAIKSEVRLFDTHCHFDFDAFASDFPTEISLAQQAGVERFLIPSIGPQNWQRVAQLAEQFPGAIYYALGFHPYFLQSDWHNPLARLERELSVRSEACIVLGEMGLDGMIAVDAQLQEQLLIGQLAIAQSAQLPVILHSRKTHNRLLQLLKQTRFQYGGVLHAFSGSVQQAQQFIDLGFHIGVGGVITYPRANKTRQAVAVLPIESLVLETDAPDMPLSGLQGQPNHPRYLPQVLDALAQLRNEDPHQLAQQLWDNSLRVFGISEA
ncbi:TatD family hydrolase [Vibrio fluvialis]|nr:TatD family hydrolase [Vibrio fluvialis]